MSLLQRVLDSIKERRQKILDGEINCIPLPFNRFRSEWPGIEQGRYYLISGATKSAKTQITSYLFLFQIVLYTYNHPEKCSAKIFYYPLEETPEEIMLRFMSYLLNHLSGNKIRISSEDLKSTREDNPLSQDILDLLESDEYLALFSHFEKIVEFMPSRNPTGVWKDMSSYAKANGTIHNKTITVKNEFGEEEERQKFDWYEPNNPNEYVFIVVDHVSLLEKERGMDLRETINKLSEYMIILRNKYKYIPVVVQQQSTETTNLEAFKANKIRPTMAGLSDSKNTAKDCNMMLGICNPYSYELPSYLGYDITKLKGNIRFLEVVLNRNGQANGICPLYFDGSTCTFAEMPLPDDKGNLDKVYEFLRNRNSISLFLVNTINNNLKKHSIYGKCMYAIRKIWNW